MRACSHVLCSNIYYIQSRIPMQHMSKRMSYDTLNYPGQEKKYTERYTYMQTYTYMYMYIFKARPFLCSQTPCICNCHRIHHRNVENFNYDYEIIHTNSLNGRELGKKAVDTLI